MTDQPSVSSDKWIYASVVILAILLANTGIFVIAYFNIQNNFYTLQENLNDQEQQLSALQESLNS